MCILDLKRIFVWDSIEPLMLVHPQKYSTSWDPILASLRALSLGQIIIEIFKSRITIPEDPRWYWIKNSTTLGGTDGALVKYLMLTTFLPHSINPADLLSPLNNMSPSINLGLRFPSLIKTFDPRPDPIPTKETIL